MRVRSTFLIAASVLVLAACGASPSVNPQPAPRNDRYDGSTAQRGPVDASKDNLSTFALDVDTASYSYATRQLNEGRRPEPGQVRPEEFINSFDQHYPEPRGDGFAVHVDGSRLPAVHHGSPEQRLIRVGLQTRSEDDSQRPDAALTFVIDVSGSMGESRRLDLVQDALHYLVDELRPTDAVAIVTFSADAKVVRPMTRVSEKEDLHRAIDSLRIEGSTNLGAGITTGYEVARDSFREGRTNRVILLSDGLANTGNTSAESLVRKIRAEADKQISLLGVGVGSEYGDQLMEQLVDHGDGFVVYISDRQQARELFVHKLPVALTVRAYDAKAQVVFNKSTVETYELIGYEDRQLADNQFRDDRVDGGEVGPGHSVTALYVVRLKPGANGQVAQIKVRWLDPQTREASETYDSVTASDLAGQFSAAAPELAVTYAAGFFAQGLRGKSDISFNELAKIVDAVGKESEDERVFELAELLRQAERIG